MLRALVLSALLIAATSAGAAECPAKVRVSFPNFDIAPLVMGKDDFPEDPGQLVVWVAKALERSGCHPRVSMQRLPPNRQLAQMQAGRIDILPGFAYSDELARDMAFPPRSLMVVDDTTSLYVRRGDKAVQWDGQHLSAPNPRIGTSTGGSSADVLARERGWVFESASTPQANLKKLIAGRVDVIIESDRVLAPYLVGADGAAVRHLEPPVRSLQRLVPVRRDFAKRYPVFTHRFWREVCKQSRLDYPQLPACKD